MTPDPDRRTLLKLLGTSLLPVTSGCASNAPPISNQKPTTTSDPPTTPSPNTTPQPTSTETATSTPVPEPVKRIDFTAHTNQKLRSKLKSISEPGYIKANQIDTENSPIVQHLNTPETSDDHPLDLTALQLYHKNNYIQSPPWVHKLVSTLPDEDKYKKPRTEDGYAPYKDGSFDFQKDLVEAETLLEAHDPLMRYIANFEEQVNKRGLHSTRDKEYAAILQESIDRYAPEVNAHIWAYKVGFGVHGFMTGYDEDKDKLYTMDTVNDSPVDAASFLEPRLIEKSPYTDSDTMWHPVQFARGEYRNRDFEYAKKDGIGMFTLIASKYDDTKGKEGIFGNPNFAATTGFTVDILNALGTYNENEYDFIPDIQSNALALEDLRRSEGEFILDEVSYEDDKIIIDVHDITNYEHSDRLIEAVWQDEQGLYNNFNQIEQEFESGDYTTLDQAAKALEA